MIEYPDVSDIQEMGSKGCIGKFSGKSGDFHAYSKGLTKSKMRRFWKRKARRQEHIEFYSQQE